MLERKFKEITIRGLKKKKQFDLCKIGSEWLIDWNTEIKSEVLTPKKKKQEHFHLAMG